MENKEILKLINKLEDTEFCLSAFKKEFIEVFLEKESKLIERQE